MCASNYYLYSAYLMLRPRNTICFKNQKMIQTSVSQIKYFFLCIRVAGVVGQRPSCRTSPIKCGQEKRWLVGKDRGEMRHTARPHRGRGRVSIQKCLENALET
jgi:hypothetical protein